MWNHRRPADFFRGEVLLLRHSADLIAGALHNASFVPESAGAAITDGLPELKRTPSSMEALFR